LEFAFLAINADYYSVFFATDCVITARANIYVDMAIAIGKKMNLFADEADLKETIDYVKARKLMKFFYFMPKSVILISKLRLD